MKILHSKLELTTKFRFYGWQSCCQHLFCELTLVERLVAKIGAKLRGIFAESAVRNNGAKIEATLSLRFTLQQFDQIYAADEVFKAANTQLSHAMTNLLCDKRKKVHNHLGQANEVLAA